MSHEDRESARRLGVKDDEAITHGCSRKVRGRCRQQSRARSTVALDYLAQEGLGGLFTIWQTLTAKDLNRPVPDPRLQVVWEKQPQG
ncbi:MAG: hypothetical protein R3C20_04735 [Planctomycetaceae bacterium]